MTVVADQPVTIGAQDYPQGPDVIAVLVPAYGFGHRFELGLPIGLYCENWRKVVAAKNEERLPILLPYAKLALFAPQSRHSLAVVAQAALVVPANIGLRYAYNRAGWEPQVGVSKIFSAQARDGSVVARYQRADQSLYAASMGAMWKGPRRPAIEVGFLQNSYAICKDCGGGSARKTVYDLYVGARIGVTK